MSHPNTLRLCVISAVLALGASCACASEADALSISANIQARHLPFGTVMDPVNAAPDSNQITGYTRCADSAIWAGHYLAAEAFRYKVTHAAEALENVKKAIAGIKSLADVTGTNLLARCLIPIDSPFLAGIEQEEASHGIHQYTAAAPNVWVGNTSRDQYMGVIFGMGVAYDMVDDPDVRTSISLLVTRLVDFLRGHNWAIVMPDGSVSTVFLARPDQILTILQVARHVNPDHYSTTYDINSVLLAAGLLAPVGLDVASDDSYFKFNLDYISLYNLIRLENGSAKDLYRKAYDTVRAHTAGHKNAFFNVIDLALNGPRAARDAETLALLEQWLQRQRRDKFVDLHGVVPVCGDQACEPVPVPLRPPTDFLWQRNPFQLMGGLHGDIESAGIDYILPYWMARYYGLAPAFTVQSAAAASLAVAPESLASLYGSNLAETAAHAGSLPLPASLGGISLTVQDSAGTERSAPLLYVSPVQINCIVPAGTVSGSATFTIRNGSATPLSATAEIKAVAPTLFSLDGSGTGTAAASAIRTQVADPKQQSLVPVFQCNQSGCTAIPIDLGVDTPVYLTLYGTGIRNRTSLSSVTVAIDGVSVPVLYAGPQFSFEGLDQVNVSLPLNLRGSGNASIALAVDGQPANTVTVNIR